MGGSENCGRSSESEGIVAKGKRPGSKKTQGALRYARLAAGIVVAAVVVAAVVIAAAVAAAVAATVSATVIAAPAVAAAAPDDDEQDDDPAAVSATKAVITHNWNLLEM